MNYHAITKANHAAKLIAEASLLLDGAVALCQQDLESMDPTDDATKRQEFFMLGCLRAHKSLKHAYVSELPDAALTHIADPAPADLASAEPETSAPRHSDTPTPRHSAPQEVPA